jgi:hypothetical protein
MFASVVGFQSVYISVELDFFLEIFGHINRHTIFWLADRILAVSLEWA